MKQDATGLHSSGAPLVLANSLDDSPQEHAHAAFELKFLVDDERALVIEAWARQHLSRDAHGDAALGGAYRTTSLYCDTPQLDVYRGARWYRRRKFRIRRYAQNDTVFLERKARSGDRVAKRRTSIAAAELSLLANRELQTLWPGYWFARRLNERRLIPACQITYERTAYVGTSLRDTTRLTLDRHIQGALTDRWCLDPVADGIQLLGGRVIVELKFRSALPTYFKQLVEVVRLVPTRVSKYRICQDAWQAKPPLKEAAGD